MSIYDNKPSRFLAQLHTQTNTNPGAELYCAGYEVTAWRCKPFAFHLAEWLPDYALPEEELRIDHGNSLLKLNQAAVRVYTSDKYKSRGEAGEIALHAICRDFFSTIPISPRVFYKSASNDVVKAFDMVHVRFPEGAPMEIWLGESKLYQSASQAITDAIQSITTHIDAGFLSNQKLLLGPQIPKTTPRYEEVMRVFRKQTSLDELLQRATFVVGVLADSPAAAGAKRHDSAYLAAAQSELGMLMDKLTKSSLAANLRILLILPYSSQIEFMRHR